MWLFVTVEGVEPTNNAAERAIRPAVLWRRTSFGTQTAAGSTFVARMRSSGDDPAVSEVVLKVRSTVMSPLVDSSIFGDAITVDRTLQTVSQQRNVLEYMTAAIRAAREGKPAPSLLPEVINSEDQVLPAA